MNYVNSKDSTRIAYEKNGKGSELIIIGGSLADHQMYIPLASELSKKFSVINFDRRNRGKSDTSTNHTVETELQDLEAIFKLCKNAPIVYGHSAGAALAIRAAAIGFTISNLILSDLPFSPINENSESEIHKFQEEYTEIKKLLEIGNKTGAVKYFLKDFGMTEEQLDEFVASAHGKKTINLGTTLPIDYEILENGLVPAHHLKNIKTPTTILTADYGLQVAEDVAKHLSNVSIKMLETPSHSAPVTEISKYIFNLIKEH
mgnify:CR=1 FL=1